MSSRISSRLLFRIKAPRPIIEVLLIKVIRKKILIIIVPLKLITLIFSRIPLVLILGYYNGNLPPFVSNSKFTTNLIISLPKVKI